MRTHTNTNTYHSSQSFCNPRINTFLNLLHRHLFDIKSENDSQIQFDSSRRSAHHFLIQLDLSLSFSTVFPKIVIWITWIGTSILACFAFIHTRHELHGWTLRMFVLSMCLYVLFAIVWLCIFDSAKRCWLRILCLNTVLVSHLRSLRASKH